MWRWFEPKRISSASIVKSEFSLVWRYLPLIFFSYCKGTMQMILLKQCWWTVSTLIISFFPLLPCLFSKDHYWFQCQRKGCHNITGRYRPTNRQYGVKWKCSYLQLSSLASNNTNPMGMYMFKVKRKVIKTTLNVIWVSSLLILNWYFPTY